MILFPGLILLLATGVPPATEWMSEEGGLLELKLAHSEKNGPDGGILRLDTLRRLILWEGIPGELGCKERIEASFEDVRSVSAGRDAGFVLEFRRAIGKKLVLLPLPHAPWFSRQPKVDQGVLPTIVREGGLAVSGGAPGESSAMIVGGSAASTAPSLKRATLPDDVVFDTRKAVGAIREALGRAPRPGAVLREALFGSPQEVSVADLVENPSEYLGRAVRARGRVSVGSSGAREHRLSEDGAEVTISPALEIAAVVGAEAAAWHDKEFEVTGVFRRAPGQGSSQPPSIVFWEYIVPDMPPAAEPGGIPRTTLAALSANPDALEGKVVRVVGCFRGRNLYGDLPPRSQKGHADWVMKDDRHAVWVTGKKPQGQGFKLDPDSSEDAANWVEVVGRPETRRGVTYVRALKVSLAHPPSPTARVRLVRRLRGGGHIPPVVIFALPLEGEEVHPDGRFVVQFNKYMDEDSFKGRVRLRYAGPPRPGDPEFASLKLTYDDSKRALVVDPGDRLERGRQLECLLLPGIADADGLGLTPRSGVEVEGAVDILRYEIGQ